MKKELHYEVVPNKDYHNKDGTNTLRLRISTGAKKWYFPVGLSASLVLYDRAYKKNPKDEAKELHTKIERIKKEAESICDAMPIFDPKAFRTLFIREATTNSGNDVLSTFGQYITQLRAEGRISTARSCETTMYSIAVFCNGSKEQAVNRLKEHSESSQKTKKRVPIKLPKLEFNEITVEWLMRYYKALQAIGTSEATAGIYIRTLRVIYNLGANKDEALRTKARYPFGKEKGKFNIPTKSKNKRALTDAQIASIFDYEATSATEQRAKDFWIFSYLCNGMNFADVAKLKYSDVTFDENGCVIEFIRQKLHVVNQIKLLLKLCLDKDTAELIRSVIDRHGNKGTNGYIFKVLNGRITPQAQYDAKQAFIGNTIKYLHKIGENLGLGIPLSTYVARHSFATALHRSGVPIVEIAEAMGHESTTTTLRYIGVTTTEKKRKNSSALPKGLQSKPMEYIGS
ncbi:MAG: tyrosine-type recombinase/integrase [Ignavibacteria bacterium]|nr:tyrosine-type recombinase/integrase [Ignavibacteria bacterium]